MNKLVVNWVVPSLMAILAATAGPAHGQAEVAAPGEPTNVAQGGSIVTVQAPMISDYWMSATRQSGGVIVFDGYAPDDATRQRLSELDNADTNFLKLGRGAPANYQAAVDFGLSILTRLSEGRFSLRDGSISVSGVATSGSDYLAASDLLTSPPRGLLLARNEIRPPAAAPYLLSATKSADGSVALEGMVPNLLARDSLAAGAGKPSVIAVTYASGEPPDLVVSATTALGLLKFLQTGSARFDGTAWHLSGTAATGADKSAIDAAIAARRLPAAGWSIAIDVAAAPETPAATKTKPPLTPTPPIAEQPIEPTAPVAEPAATEPAVAPEPVQPVAKSETPAPTTAPLDPAYAFTATRGAGGAVTMSGKLPADPALRFFGIITGAATTGVTIATGAPADFILNAEAGIRALMQLENAQLRFAAGKWSLSGKAASNADRTAVLASVAALPQGSAWTLDITAPPALDACQASVDAFSARNSILFQSGAAVLAPESEPALDELAGYLASCPAADVDIEGHTDADGDDQVNLALSVARAEAVIEALIARHIPGERLYAIGYGESQPIADNDTAVGKRLNRRIVVEVLEHHVD